MSIVCTRPPPNPRPLFQPCKACFKAYESCPNPPFVLFLSCAKRASKPMNLAETRRVSIVFARWGGGCALPQPIPFFVSRAKRASKPKKNMKSRIACFIAPSFRFLLYSRGPCPKPITWRNKSGPRFDTPSFSPHLCVGFLLLDSPKRAD